MAQTDFQDVDEYIATFPEDVQALLRTVRQTIREAVPGAEETISYQIPAYKFHGWLLYFSAYKRHWSLSSPPSKLFETFKEQLADYNVSKSAIQFPLDQPVPVQLIHDMAIWRAEDLRARAAAAPAKRK